MNAASYLPLLVLGLGGVIYAAWRRRRAPVEDAPLVRLGLPSAGRAQASDAGLRIAIVGGGLLLLALLVAPAIAQVGAPRCATANGGSPCTDGEPLSPLPLVPPLLVAAPLLVLAAREVRSL